MAAQRLTDRWGSGVGTQAARINELLSVAGFRSAGEVYDILVHEFPTTTFDRVHQHMGWLRQNHRAHLLEYREGHRVSFRLVVE